MEFSKSKNPLEKRCWKGYRAVPGKKAYSDGSCEKIPKQKKKKRRRRK